MDKQRIALVIANGDYESLSQLESAACDAREIQAVLENQCGFHVTLLLNQSRSQIEDAIQDFFANANRNHLCLLYFSGHGMEDNGRLYLAANETVPQKYYTAIDVTWINARMNASNSRKQMVWLDCCYSGAVLKEWDFHGHGGILTACRKYQLASAGDHHRCSPFTAAIVRGFQIWDNSRSEKITFPDLASYVYRQLTESDQKPTVWYRCNDDIILAVKLDLRQPESQKILILEDEQAWRDRHQAELEKQGLNCIATTSAEDAIKHIRKDFSIRFALIDEILYEPAVLFQPPVRQQWQGEDVMRLIREFRPDIHLISVTCLPDITDNGAKEMNNLEIRQGVLFAFNKARIDVDVEVAYELIARRIKAAPVTETIPDWIPSMSKSSAPKNILYFQQDASSAATASILTTIQGTQQKALELSEIEQLLPLTGEWILVLTEDWLKALPELRLQGFKGAVLMPTLEPFTALKRRHRILRSAQGSHEGWESPWSVPDLLTKLEQLFPLEPKNLQLIQQELAVTRGWFERIVLPHLEALERLENDRDSNLAAIERSIADLRARTPAACHEVVVIGQEQRQIQQHFDKHLKQFREATDQHEQSLANLRATFEQWLKVVCSVGEGFQTLE